MRTKTENTVLTAATSARILAFKLDGATTKEAFDLVLGAGYYDRLVEELYTELRAKAANQA